MYQLGADHAMRDPAYRETQPARRRKHRPCLPWPRRSTRDRKWDKHTARRSDRCPRSSTPRNSDVHSLHTQESWTINSAMDRHNKIPRKDPHTKFGAAKASKSPYGLAIIVTRFTENNFYIPLSPHHRSTGRRHAID